MDRRSTGDRFVHSGGDVVSNVESSHGVTLRGGSTGGIIEPIGDDTSISLTVRARNAGLLNLGTSTGGAVRVLTGSSVVITSTHVNINSSRTVIGASTTPIILVQRSRIDFTVPALSSNSADLSVEVAVTGLTTNALCFIQQRQVYNSTVTAAIGISGYCSTAGALRLNIFNHSVSSLSGSTMSADLWRIECPVAV